jgi:hypothetical protein
MVVMMLSFVMGNGRSLINQTGPFHPPADPPEVTIVRYEGPESAPTADLSSPSSRRGELSAQHASREVTAPDLGSLFFAGQEHVLLADQEARGRGQQRTTTPFQLLRDAP